MTKELTGIIAPITTPFVDDEVSLSHLRENVLRYRTTRLAGLFALGSNGESKSLTEKEKLDVLEVVLNAKGEHQSVIAGTGYESTRQTISFSKEAGKLGVDGVAILTPSYFRKHLTEVALIRYYRDVADATPVPVYAYNAPSFTGIALSSRIITAISEHPNIIGIKDSAATEISDYMRVCRAGFRVFAGSIEHLLTALVLGATGGVVSLANALPEDCHELFTAVMAGDLVKARSLHFRLCRLNRTVSGAFGVAGVKYAMDLNGFHGGLPRLPLLPLTDSEKGALAEGLRAFAVSAVLAE